MHAIFTFGIKPIAECYRSTFHGLRSDTDYVIKISFVMSGRKLGSESFTILSHDNPIRKLSNTSNIDRTVNSKDNHESSISTDMVSHIKIS